VGGIAHRFNPLISASWIQRLTKLVVELHRLISFNPLISASWIQSRRKDIGVNRVGTSFNPLISASWIQSLWHGVSMGHG